MLANASLASWLHRIYIDLGPIASDGLLHPFGVQFDYRNLHDGAALPRLQAVLMPSFRTALLRLCEARYYDVQDPRCVPPHVRTPRWARLCEAVDAYDSLPVDHQVLVLRLLAKLGLYTAVLMCAAPVPADAIAQDEDWAQVAWLRAQARYVLSLEHAGAYCRDEFQVISDTAPRAGMARIEALYQMCVQNVKHAYNYQALCFWLHALAEEITRAHQDLEPAAYCLLKSRQHRVAAFAPSMLGDRAAVQRALDLAQHHAEALPGNAEEQQLCRREMLFRVQESRAREARWAGQLDLACERASRLVMLAPLESRGRALYGDMLLAHGQVEAALEQYTWAGRTGPPGLPAAFAMAGQCHETLGQPERALDAYLIAMRLDPTARRVAERLDGVARQLGYRAVTPWTAQRCAALHSAPRQCPAPVRLQASA